jgi:hypothetical protein
MSKRSLQSCYVKQATSVLIALSCCALSGLGAADNDKPGDKPKPPPLTVPKAVCGFGDHPETALQGQVPAALRAAGFQGFNCNLELVGQSKGDGANWQSAEYRSPSGNGDKKGDSNKDEDGRNGKHDQTVCAYHGTAFTTAGRTHVGVPVIDITDNANPTPKGYLATISMLDPWESLKVNERRQLLGADNGHNGGGGPEVDIYDLSGGCDSPQLLATIAVGKADGSTGTPDPVIGHEGSWAPDGLTYYGGDLRTNGGQYYAVDTTDPTAPKLITVWHPGFANVHGMSISDDGNRGYFVSLGTSGGAAGLTDPTIAANNGLLIYDLSEIQTRQSNPQAKLVSTLFWKDGSGAQHTIPVKIDGKPYLIFVDEAGSGGFSSAAQQAAACAAGMPPFPMARIIDISDETNPTIVSRLALEIHNPANCASVLPDLVGLAIFTYGSHYCSVDNKDKATTLACGYFNSGIRVFDIRDPTRPKEIAYYNPAGTTTSSPGSNHFSIGQWRAGGPDWCSAQVHLNADNGTLWTTCQDNGLLTLKFTHGAWPFPQSKTPVGEQN